MAEVKTGGPRADPPEGAAPRAANDGAPPLGLRERAPEPVPVEKDNSDALGLLAGILIVAALGAVVLRSMDGPPPAAGLDPVPPPARIVAGPPVSEYRAQRAADAAPADAPPAPDLVEMVPLELPGGYDLSAPDNAPVYSLDPGAPAQTVPAPGSEFAAPALIYDGGAETTGRTAIMIEPETAATEPASPRTAAPAGQRQSTLARGTLMPSVLESPVDTREPGAVRALVTADIRSFDGKRTLVPRSSRLVGQYQPVTINGAPRAYVVWTRLVRPDGSMVRLAAPPPTGLRAFMEAFRTAALLSVLGSGATAQGGAIRIRTGEPIRVFLGRNFDLGSGR